MSPSPVTTSSPTEPASYSWEATNEAVAERYGLPVEAIVRFDLNTSPAPPRLLGELLAAGRFSTPISEYPPGDYRALVEAAAATYGVGTDEIVPGAGADEVLEMCVKAFLRAGEAAVVPVPSYAMYRVVIEQRGGLMVGVPRLGRTEGWAMDVPAVRTAARGAAMVWLCNPNNPTGTAEPAGAIESLLDGIAIDAAADAPQPGVGRGRRGLRGVHGSHHDPASRAAPEPGRDPHGVQGLRPGRAQGRLCGGVARHPGAARAVSTAGLDRHHLGDRGHAGPARWGGDAGERRAGRPRARSPHGRARGRGLEARSHR